MYFRLLLFLAFITVGMLSARAQNLQFSQVLNLSFSSNGTNFSVPAGKVWKLETVGLSSYSSYFSISVGGQSIFLKNTHTSYGPVFESFPFWINGGQSVFLSGLTSGVASVVEFNVVP
jgi:hypothetical protein